MLPLVNPLHKHPKKCRVYETFLYIIKSIVNTGGYERREYFFKKTGFNWVLYGIIFSLDFWAIHGCVRGQKAQEGW